MEDIKKTIAEVLDKYIFDKKVWENAPENPKVIADLKINSARIIDIVLDLEEKFDIEIDDESLEKINTLNDIVNIIKSKQGR